MVRHHIGLAGRRIGLPRSRILRIAIGSALVLAGLVGFLPVLGFWMLPLGLLILSVDLSPVRRARRRLTVGWERRRRSRSGRASARR
jgi:hypothetical protein